MTQLPKILLLLLLLIFSVSCEDEKINPKINFTIEEENMPIVVKGMELGINDYFMYPVDKSELKARIKTQLRRNISTVVELFLINLTMGKIINLRILPLRCGSPNK